MIELNYKGIIAWLIIGILAVFLIAFILSAGCMTAGKNVVKEVMKTPTPTPTPSPTPTLPPPPTPRPTPIAIETLAAHYVDPYIQGERWEGQWFKWLRLDVTGKKDLNIGIIVYRHAFMDYYTWYDAPLGNYQVQKPKDGYRYFLVWVHEEMLGDNQTYDPSMWIFDETAFRLQVKGQLYEADETHNPVNRIRELDRKWDYYNTVTAGPFAWDLRYTGVSSPSQAGYVAERRGWLRWGPGNAVDGYIIFEIPKDSMEEDITLNSGFGRFGSALWRFTK
jgi:hypothetical protein